jgi:hypothetical protein
MSRTLHKWLTFQKDEAILYDGVKIVFEASHVLKTFLNSVNTVAMN